MKKIFLLLPVMFIHYLAPAQGLVDFYNNSTEAISVKASAGPAYLTTANSYYFALFYSTKATTVLGSSASVTASEAQIGDYAFQDANWTFAGYTASGTSSAPPGVFTNYVFGNPSSSSYSTVSGLASGTPAHFVVIGWSANIGSTLPYIESFVDGKSSANYGYIGESAVSGEITPGNGTTLAVPTLFGAAAPALQGFTLGEYNYQSTPEPSTIALGAAGTFFMAAFYRSKNSKRNNQTRK